MPFRRFVAVAVCAWIFIVAVLLLDGPGWPTQLALATATGLFLWWMVQGSSITRLQIFVMIGIATCGEIVGSLIWGLYKYRNFLIPLYVPVGHGLFYALAFVTAEQKRVAKYDRVVVPSVIAGGTVYAIGNLIVQGDVMGALGWWGAACLILVSGNARLLSFCFLYTAVLEVAGTMIGNWTWMETVPILGIPQGNPPSGAGLGYAIFDFLTVLAVAALARRPEPGLAGSE